MDKEKAILCALKYIKEYEESDSDDRFDLDDFSEKLGLNDKRTIKIVKTLLNEGLAEGFFVISVIGGEGIKPNDPSITTIGLSYLRENSTGKKVVDGLNKAFDVASKAKTFLP